MKTNINALRRFTVAMIVTILVASAVSGTLIALNRMENTLNTNPFTVFSIERKAKNQLILTAMNQSYHINLSNMNKKVQKLTPLKKTLPPFINGFFSSISSLIEKIYLSMS